MGKIYKDERTEAEQNKISIVSLILILCISAVSLVIKAFSIELSFFNYGAEFITIGFCAIFGIILSVFLLKSKRLDERSKLILGRIATIFFIVIMLSFIGILIAMIFNSLSNNVLVPYTSSCVIITNLYRIIMTKTISRKAVELEYKEYKKQTFKSSIIAIIIILTTSIILTIIAGVSKNAILLLISMTIFWVGIATTILTAIFCIRGKKSYDKSVD